jgi:CRISPR-associated protein Cmr3
MVANFDRSTKKLLNSSKSNPCPVCGRTKDGDCRISRDGKMVLCHQNFDHTKTQQPDVWHFDGTSSDNRCGVYVFKEKTTKSIRPKQTRYWEYPDRDGSRLVRVERVDDGFGNKKVRQQHWDKNKKDWVYGWGDVVRASIPIYRRAEVREAIAKGETVYIVEGEPCADLLWKLGLAATTNIGGGTKFTLTDSMDLQGAKVIVIVPDRDKKGIEHAEKVAEYFPHALWLYPFPESKFWENLPEDHGLDLADWIEHHRITAEDIKAAIGEKKVFKAPEASSQVSSKVITHARFTSPNPAELRAQMRAIVDAGITGSERTAAIGSLPGNTQQNWKLYEEISEEIEREQGRLDLKADIENLLKIDKNRLNLEEYLPSDLANPIKQVASWMGVDAEAFLTYLLPIAASLVNPSSYILAKKCTNYKQPFVLYSGVVALTGDRKTPPLDAVKSPLVQLQIEEDAKHEQALQRYEAEMQAIQNTKPKGRNNEELPQKPKPPREFFVDNATVEALDKIKGQQPEHGLVSIKDELSGLFASHGAYKGGKGADKESYLSGWNGGGIKKNRAGDGSRVSLPRDSLSITGGIQPDKICSLLGDFNDSQGEWARFLWYHMPTRPYKIPRDDTSYSLDGLLLDIYKKIDAVPILKLHFDKQGQTHFDDWYDAKDVQKRAEFKPGLRAAIAKMPGQAIRLIGVLHVLNNVNNGDVPSEISLATVQAGCRLADFYLGQVTLLQSNGDTLSGELTPVLKEIYQKVHDGRASLTAREVIASMRGLRRKSASQIRELFLELAAMDLVGTKGKGVRLALVPKSADNKPITHNPYSTRNVENITSKLLTTADKVLTSSKQVESQSGQRIQEINYQSADSADAFDATKNNLECFKVELDNLPDTSSADKNGILKEFVSTSALDAESSTSQGDNAADSPSADCQQPSAVCSEPERLPVCSSSAEPIVLSGNSPEPETSQTAPEATPTTPATGVNPAIKKGDRVVIARSDSPRYRGVKGEVIDDNIWGANGLEFHIRFDKKISNILQDYFPAADVMREPC